MAEPGIYHEFESQVADEETEGLIKPQAHWNAKHKPYKLLGYELVEEKSVPAGSTQIVFTSLNGDEDEEYLLEGFIVLTSNASSLCLYPNSDTAANYVGVVFYGLNPSSTGASNTNTLRLGQINNTVITQLRFTASFYPKSGFLRQFESHCSHALAGRSLITHNAGHWTNIVDTVNSLLIKLDGASGSFQGKIRLWKKIPLDGGE